MIELEGQWELVGYQHLTDEISYDEQDDGPRVEEIQAWLLGADDVTLDTVPHRAGLQLKINSDAFRESVTSFDELMFDASGVQVNDYQPMAGKLRTITSVAYLVPDSVPEFAKPEPADDMVVRYDDGDTIVCDTLRRFGEYLVRQIAVVTDEIYLERMLLIYRDSGDTD